MYGGNLINYDINNSNLNATITPEIFKNLTFFNNEYNDMNNEYDDINSLISDRQINMTFLNENELNEKVKMANSDLLYVSSFSGNSFNDTFNFDIYYNISMIHSLPSTINLLSNGVLASNNRPEKIVTYSHPLSYNDYFNHTIAELMLSLFACVCVTFVVSYFAPYTVRERDEFLKKQLKLNGINNKCYWISNFIVHFSLLFLLCIGITELCAICGIEDFKSITNFTVLLIIQSISCASTILFQYFLSFYFKTESNSYLICVLINLIPVFYLTIYDFKYEFISMEYNESEVTSIYKVFYEIFAFQLFPVSYIPISLVKILRINALKEVTGETVTFKSLIKYRNGLLTLTIGNIFSMIFYMYMIYYNQKKDYKKKLDSITTLKDESINEYVEALKEGDEDVFQEYCRIKNENNTKMSRPIKVLQASKEYPSDKSISYDTFINGMKNKNPKYGEYHISDYEKGRLFVTALKNVSLGINKNECFGLIGPNGSGKSTLLNIFTYTTVQSAGEVLFDDVENTKIREDQFRIGYCPQNDSLWKELTLFEHLIMYLYIRGYSKKDSKKYAVRYMSYCKIEEHKNKYPNELSGGTKRKLCILLALICFSDKIILDEPTSGMDPATRRYVWNMLRDYMNDKNSSIILTTHCMEEAELLCDRIGIIVNGSLQCIGSPNHLKMKFSDTYVLEIQCSNVNVVDTQIKKDLDVINSLDTIREIKSETRVRYTFNIYSNFNDVFTVMENYKLKNIVYD